MATERIDYVTKLNKGTSRTEYGVLNYWGYKTPDGKIRARLYAPNDNGYATLSVVKFQLPANTWRRKITFEDAVQIGSALVKVENLDKGFTSDEALTQVNAIIEIHNDYFDKHVGRKVRVQNYSSPDAEITYADAGYDVTGVHFNMSSEGLKVNLVTNSHTSLDVDRTTDYTEDFAKSRVITTLDDLQKKINNTQQFLDDLVMAHAKGERYNRDSHSTSHVGLLVWTEVNKLVALVNEFAVEKETVA